MEKYGVFRTIKPYIHGGPDGEIFNFQFYLMDMRHRWTVIYAVLYDDESGKLEGWFTPDGPGAEFGDLAASALVQLLGVEPVPACTPQMFRGDKI